MGGEEGREGLKEGGRKCRGDGRREGTREERREGGEGDEGDRGGEGREGRREGREGREGIICVMTVTMAWSGCIIRNPRETG